MTGISEERARELLSRMTLDEKVQQLTSVDPYGLMASGMTSRAQMDLLLSQGIGHVAMFAMFQHKSTPDHARTVNAIQRYLVEETRLGIPAIFHIEALNGLVAPEFTAYPTGIALAATWNPLGVQEMTTNVSRQARAMGYTQALSPVMDVARDARWGRVHETFGEDAYLASEFAVAFTRGMQSGNAAESVIATGKHFLGFGVTEGGQHMAATNASWRELREVFARPFETAIREAALGSVMNSYSTVDGVPAGASKAILTDLLRDELGFEGTVVADYGTISGLADRQGVAPDWQTAGIIALEAGLDIELPVAAGYGPTLAHAVRAGRVSESLVDRSTLRILTDKFALGLFDEPYVAEDDIRLNELAKDGAELAADLARQSVVLLSNDGTLPLVAPHRIAVIGPHSDEAGVAFPAYTYFGALGLLGAVENNGPVKMAGLENINADLPEAAREALTSQLGPQLESGLAAYAHRHYGAETLTEALRRLLPDSEIVSVQGCGVLDDVPEGIQDAVEAATSADVVVLALGGRAGWFGQNLTEGEGSDQANIDLPLPQVQLARAVAAVGRPTAAVVFTGRPFALTSLDDLPLSIVYAQPGGQAGIAAVAEVLVGITNPSGKLPISLPRHSGQVPIHYNQHFSTGYRRTDKDMHAGYNDLSSQPLYPFGHGLSYSSFSYSELTVDHTTIPTDGTVRARVTVTNVGHRAGTEVTQFYASHRAHAVTRPAQELVGFARVTLEPGQSRIVENEFSTGQLAYLGIDERFTFDAGAIEVQVGASSDDIRSRTTVMAVGTAADWNDNRPLLPNTNVGI